MLLSKELRDATYGMAIICVRISHPVVSAGGRDRMSIRRATRWFLTRVRQLAFRRLVLLAEAWGLMLAARVALHTIPVSRILRWQARPVTSRTVMPTLAGALRQDVRWAIVVAARRSPVRLVCFPQCLAGSALLRWRGIESRLHYGVARKEGKLVTHTWLEAGGEILIGGESLEDFSTLAVYGHP